MLKRAPDQRLIIEWTIATIAGLLIALASFFSVTENDAPKVNLFLFMIMPFWLAIAQWVVLRRYIYTAWPWVVATVLGVYVAIVTVLFVYPSSVTLRFFLLFELPGKQLY